MLNRSSDSLQNQIGFEEGEKTEKRQSHSRTNRVRLKVEQAIFDQVKVASFPRANRVAALPHVSANRPPKQDSTSTTRTRTHDANNESINAVSQ
jgi:hypothetical protein